MMMQLSTASIPRKFLKAAFLVGHVPQRALQADPRISYSLYIPERHYDAKRDNKLRLLVYIHGTGRNLSPMYSDLATFADETPCAVLAPLFPAGLDGPNDLDSYKRLRSQSLRSDLMLLHILDEVANSWPGIATSKVYLMGFSGGGQFAHRFACLYPERLTAVSVGAPGSVTLLDQSQKWPLGVADIEMLFGRTIALDQLKLLHWQLAVGGDDNEIHGGKEFWAWAKQMRASAESGRPPETSLDADGAEVMLPSVSRESRVDILRRFSRSLKDHGIVSRFDVVNGAGHDAQAVRPQMLDFLRVQMTSSSSS
jgi:poly(3-hydroxybutyrate) depolymerase